MADNLPTGHKIADSAKVKLIDNTTASISQGITISNIHTSAATVDLYLASQSGSYITDTASQVNFTADSTATITITDYTELNSGDKVNLIATDGTNYDFTNGSQSSVSGTWESTTSNNATATNLMNVINTSSGPAGTRFTATVLGAVVTVTQATQGTAGNTTVTLTDSGTAGMTSTSFTGGGDDDYAVTTSSQAIVIDYTGTVSTSDMFLNEKVYKSDGTFVGTCTVWGSATGITFGGGLEVALNNNDDLYTGTRYYIFKTLSIPAGITLKLEKDEVSFNSNIYSLYIKLAGSTPVDVIIR